MRDKTNKEWRELFSQRLLQFSVRIIFLVNRLPKTPAGYAIANQIVKSGTSIGANFVEAQDASSIKDFIQKLSISLREAQETCYWLQVIKGAKLIDALRIESELKECGEIKAILVSSIKSSKAKLV